MFLVFALYLSSVLITHWCFEVPPPIFPCEQANPPWWCTGVIEDRIGIDPGPCRCPDVVVPENLGENETIVIKTIPGRVSDTLEISKELNPQPLPPGEGNITLNR
jgi:hypothetical protein